MDIPALADYFLNTRSKEMGLPYLPTLAPRAIDVLAAYHWPGNVRELENTIERALIVSRGEPLSFQNLQETEIGCRSEPESKLPSEFPSMDEAIAGHIQKALRMTRGRIEGDGGAAELLNLKPSTLRNRMNRLGISYGRKRNS